MRRIERTGSYIVGAAIDANTGQQLCDRFPFVLGLPRLTGTPVITGHGRFGK